MLCSQYISSNVLSQVLREDVEAALAEASLAQERAALLGLEREELQRQRDQLAGTLYALLYSPISCQEWTVQLHILQAACSAQHAVRGRSLLQEPHVAVVGLQQDMGVILCLSMCLSADCICCLCVLQPQSIWTVLQSSMQQLWRLS